MKATPKAGENSLQAPTEARKEKTLKALLWSVEQRRPRERGLAKHQRALGRAGLAHRRAGLAPRGGADRSHSHVLGIGRHVLDAPLLTAHRISGRALGPEPRILRPLSGRDALGLEPRILRVERRRDLLPAMNSELQNLRVA